MMSKFIIVIVVFLIADCNNQANDPIVPSNSLIWKYPIPKKYLDITQPIIEYGAAYIASDTTLSKVNIHDGTRLWKRSLGNKTNIDAMQMIHDQNNVFINIQNTVLSFSKNHGTLNWQSDIISFKYVDINSMSSDDEYLYLGGYNEVVKLRKDNGAFTERYDFTIGKQQYCASPQIAGDKLIIGTTVLAPAANEGNLYCIDVHTKNKLWELSFPPWKEWNPALHDSIPSDSNIKWLTIHGDAIIVCSGTFLLSISVETGKVNWRSVNSTGGFHSKPLVVGNTIFVGSNDQSLYSFNKTNGKLNWSCRTRGSISGILSYYNDKVYFCNSGGGEIWIISSLTGKVLWNSFPPDHSANTENTYLSNLAIGEGYMINVGSNNVYCLKQE